MSLRGYSVTASARVARLRWITGDGAAYTSTSCGAKPDPEGDGREAAARHMYETKGDYELRLELAWTGSYTFAGHGRSGGGSLGEVTTVSRRPYRVIEVRSVLTD